MIAYMRLATIKDDDNSIAYSPGTPGTWNTTGPLNDMYGKFNHYTGVPGATATTSFSGDRITVGTFGLCSSAGTIRIKVDNTVKFEQNMGNQCTHHNNYTPYAVELRNLGSGNHTLTISKSDSTSGFIYVDYIGVPSVNPPVIIYNGITKMEAERYDDSVYAPYTNGSDAAVANCNQAISQMIVNSFDLDVVFVDQSNYNPNTEALICRTAVPVDFVHPNDAGHLKLQTNISNKWPNIAPRATLSASSQYSANYAPTKAADMFIGFQDSGEWASSGQQNPWIQLNWSSNQQVHKVVLYDRKNLNDAANGGTLSFSDGSTVPVTGIPNNGTRKIVTFPAKNVSWMKFQVSGGSGQNVGLSEVEVF
jgi:hypothetical protein